MHFDCSGTVHNGRNQEPPASFPKPRWIKEADNRARTHKHYNVKYRQAHNNHKIRSWNSVDSIEHKLTRIPEHTQVNQSSFQVIQSSFRLKLLHQMASSYFIIIFHHISSTQEPRPPSSCEKIDDLIASPVWVWVLSKPFPLRRATAATSNHSMEWIFSRPERYFEPLAAAWLWALLGPPLVPL